MEEEKRKGPRAVCSPLRPSLGQERAGWGWGWGWSGAEQGNQIQQEQGLPPASWKRFSSIIREDEKRWRLCQGAGGRDVLAHGAGQAPAGCSSPSEPHQQVPEGHSCPQEQLLHPLSCLGWGCSDKPCWGRGVLTAGAGGNCVPGFGAWPGPGGSSEIPVCLQHSQDSLQAQHGVGPSPALAFNDPHLEQEQLGTETFPPILLPFSPSARCSCNLRSRPWLPGKNTVPGAPEGLERRFLLIQPWGSCSALCQGGRKSLLWP